MRKFNQALFLSCITLNNVPALAETIDLNDSKNFSQYEREAKTLSEQSLKNQQAEIEDLKQSIYLKASLEKNNYNQLNDNEKQVFDIIVQKFLPHFQQCAGKKYFQKDVNNAIIEVYTLSDNNQFGTLRDNSFRLVTKRLSKSEVKAGLLWKGSFEFIYYDKYFEVESAVLTKNRTLYYYHQNTLQNPIKATIFPIYKPFDCEEITKPILYQKKLDKAVFLNQAEQDKLKWERQPNFAVETDKSYELKMKLLVNEHGRVANAWVIEPHNVSKRAYYAIRQGLNTAKIPETGKLAIIILPIKIQPAK